MRKRLIAVVLAVAAGLGLAAQRLITPSPLSAERLAELHASPLTEPLGAMRVYHLGHSLVGRDMPAMLAQMAGQDHLSQSQLGWGASLASHWKDDVPGFAEENASPAFRPAREALGSGDYDAVILTEMVELKDAIRWHDSATNLARWAALARKARPDVRIYLYETWHNLDDPDGWQERIAADRAALWEAQVLAPAMARGGVGTIHIIPGGQVMAAVATEAEAGRIPGLRARADFFSDTIHLSDIGAYVVALTHYAVLYHRLPDDTPGRVLHRADGTPADPLPPGAEAALRAVVWRVVSQDPATGIATTGKAEGGS